MSNALKCGRIEVSKHTPTKTGGTRMTEKEMREVASTMDAESLMDTLVRYGMQIETADTEDEKNGYRRTIGIIKDELTNRILGLSERRTA